MAVISPSLLLLIAWSSIAIFIAFQHNEELILKWLAAPLGLELLTFALPVPVSRSGLWMVLSSASLALVPQSLVTSLTYALNYISVPLLMYQALFLAMMLLYLCHFIACDLEDFGTDNGGAALFVVQPLPILH